jgi:hypothetical protein
MVSWARFISTKYHQAEKVRMRSPANDGTPPLATHVDAHPQRTGAGRARHAHRLPDRSTAGRVELTKLGRSLLAPVSALGQWARRNRSAIQVARQRFDAAQKAR